MQGLLVPAITATFAWSLRSWFPGGAGGLDLGSAGAFLLNFVFVDYLYYWNHRLLHGRSWWPWHRVHHGLDVFDGIGASRNSLLSSFLILYVWVHVLALYLLADPVPYLFAAALTSALDLWRHSTLGPSQGSWLDRGFGSLLMLPRHHAVHHGADGAPCNFGANLNWWDRLHGTWDPDPPSTLGIPTRLPLGRALLWPYP